MSEEQNWRDFVMPWGKYQGKTMFQIYHNYYSYIVNFLLKEDITDEVVVAAAMAARDHKDRVDPYSNYD